MFKAHAKIALLQGSVGDQEDHCERVAELSQVLSMEHHPCVQPRQIGVRAGRRVTCLVAKNRERHDGSRMANFDSRAVCGVSVSSTGRVYGLAVVTSWLLSTSRVLIDSALAGVRELYEWDHGSM